jgi:hypothetical protein
LCFCAHIACSCRRRLTTPSLSSSRLPPGPQEQRGCCPHALPFLCKFPSAFAACACIHTSRDHWQISSKGDKAQAAKEFKCACSCLPIELHMGSSHLGVFSEKLRRSCRGPLKKPRKRRLECELERWVLLPSATHRFIYINSHQTCATDFTSHEICSVVPFIPLFRASCSWDCAPPSAWHMPFGSCSCRAAARAPTLLHQASCKHVVSKSDISSEPGATHERNAFA